MMGIPCWLRGMLPVRIAAWLARARLGRLWAIVVGIPGRLRGMLTIRIATRLAGARLGRLRTVLVGIPGRLGSTAGRFNRRAPGRHFGGRGLLARTGFRRRLRRRFWRPVIPVLLAEGTRLELAHHRSLAGLGHRLNDRLNPGLISANLG